MTAFPWWTSSSFNPLPPCSGGRTDGRRGNRGDITVSIRSRLVQAGERRMVSQITASGCFNPLPPCSGGRTTTDMDDLDRAKVSIRSRLVQAGERIARKLLINGMQVSIRSRLVQAGERDVGDVLSTLSMFQSAPALFRRENSRFPMMRKWVGEFQSAPALFRRENFALHGGLPFTDCFNPLPPCSGGRTATGSPANTATPVSIRSRLVQAGEPCTRAGSLMSLSFQSAPALFRRENRAPVRPGSPARRFNPLPPCSGGRTRGRFFFCGCVHVSIRSRLVQAGELP